MAAGFTRPVPKRNETGKTGSGAGDGSEDAGQKLKRIRERLGLKYRDVEQASLSIAQRHGNDEYFIALSRLSDIEKKSSVPSVFRLYSLCAIYHLDIAEVLRWFGVPLGSQNEDRGARLNENTHLTSLPAVGIEAATVPLALDPGMELRCTTFLSRMVQRWGTLPLTMIGANDPDRYLFGYIGSEDWSMYPILSPGALVVIDPARRDIAAGTWRNEYERPIHFVEHREGFLCGWCGFSEDGSLIIQAHPVSGRSPRSFRYPAEAQVIGQVTSAAMDLTPGHPPDTRS